LKKLFAVSIVILLALMVMSCLPASEKYVKEANDLYDEGKFAEAAQQCTRAIEIDSKNIKAYLTRAAAYTELTKYDEALADLGKVIELDSENTMAYYQRSMTNIFAQKYDASIADSNKVLKMGLENHFVYYNRGVAYARKGNLDFALADFIKAKSLTDNAEFNRRIDGEINQLKAAMGK
jgi:tetratricopeptide (TPR) repeat protein